MSKIIKISLFLILSFFAFNLFSNNSLAASIITGAGPGGGPHVRSFDNNGTAETDPNKLFAYAEDYRGGVRVACGDIDNDNVDEIITGTGENGGPHLRVFEKDGQQRGIQFFPFDEDFRGGMDVASGDFEGDGKEDIAVSQFSNGQAWVKVYRYNSDRTILFERNVFGEAEVGATVAMGDVDSDGRDELIVGAGDGVVHVRVFDFDEDSLEGTLKPISFYNIDESISHGVDVAAGDIDGDRKAEIAISPLREEVATVRVLKYNSNQTVLGDFAAYGTFATGANVDMADVDNDDMAEVITGAGPTGGPQVRGFEADGTIIDGLNGFFAYDENFRGGVDVGGSHVWDTEEDEDDSNDDTNDDTGDGDSDDINDVPSFRLPIDDIDVVTGIQIFHDPSSSSEHSGFDFKLEDPTPIYAPIDGIVSDIIKIQMSNNLWIVDVLIDYNSVYNTFIAFEPYTYEESVIDDQIDSLVVSEGETVTEGQLLGTLESVPATEFPHIHWQVQIGSEPVRPYNYCSSSAKAQLDILYNRFNKNPTFY